MNKTFKFILKKVYFLYEAVTNYRFYNLRKQTNGMLWPVVYKTMYEQCRNLPDLDIIEIGGATGAGSVAIAWGMKDANKKSQLIVVEKCEGGTRSDVGGYDDNLALIQEHFNKFDVNDKITLFPQEVTFDNGNDVISLVTTKTIAAFIHDADGRLDRDFLLFWPILKSNGLIIVDDYADEPKYKPISERHPQGGTKSVMTYRLLNQIIEWGLFKTSKKIGKTIFGYKPADADFSRFDLEVCNQIIEGVKRERDNFLNEREAVVQIR